MLTTKLRATAYAALLLMTGSAFCAAAPKVTIRIVPRSTPEENATPVGPVPLREPMVFYQGPFVGALESLDCLKANPVAIKTEAALLDMCHLKNVTYVVKRPELVEGSEGNENTEPETRKILGIYRGWLVDPITMRYKQMLFDDGDECEGTSERISFKLEIVPTKNKEAKSQFYDFKQVDQCSFSAKLFVHVPPSDIKPFDGIHTPGVVDITNVQESLPLVCGQMTCKYNTISAKIRAVMTQVRQSQKQVLSMSSKDTSMLANMTLNSSKSILQSSNLVLERSLELLNTLEDLQLELQKTVEEAQRSSEDDMEEEDPVEQGEAGDKDAGSNSSQDGSGEEGDVAQQQAAIEEVVVEKGFKVICYALWGDWLFASQLNDAGAETYCIPTRGSDGATSAALVLQRRRQQLEDELLRFQRQKTERVRQERRVQVKSQLQQLEGQVFKYEMELHARTFSPNGAFSAAGESAVNTMAQLESNPSTSRTLGSNARQTSSESPSLQDLLAKLIQQNEELKVVILAQRESSSRASAGSADIVTKGVSPDQHSPRPPAQPDRPSIKFSDMEAKTTTHKPDSTPRKPESIPGKHQQEITKWGMNLPEIDWTDEDELMLQHLDSGDLDDAMVLPSTLSANTAGSTTTANSKKTAERDRTESRKRLAKLINTSMNSTRMRKPRWRIDMERESGEVSSFSDQDVEPMAQTQIFRSVAYAVIFTVQLRFIIRTKKLEQKDKALRDFESMLNVYFDATRIWLGKVVRNPLLSVLQDPGLDLDLSTKSSSKGFATKFGALFALRPQKSNINGPTGMDEGKFVKLKVRVKGIVDTIAKAVERQDIPSGILDFWRRLTSDGLYFPESYKLFPAERGALEFDELGATRRSLDEPPVDSDQGLPDDPDSTGRNKPVSSRFDVVLANFLFVRILVPHILLQPWQVGIGSAHMNKATALNLKNLATTFYQICARLSQLSPVVTISSNSSVVRRASLSQLNQESGTKEATSDEQVPEESAFLSIEDIGQLLIPNANFPVENPRFQRFAQEQQLRLEGVLRKLRLQIHKQSVPT